MTARTRSWSCCRTNLACRSWSTPVRISLTSSFRPMVTGEIKRRPGMSENTSPSSDRNRLAAERNQRESKRIDLVRRIPYTLTKSYDEDEFVDHHGTEISVNITSQGMLLMMEEAPKTEQIMNVRVPT